MLSYNLTVLLSKQDETHIPHSDLYKITVKKKKEINLINVFVMYALDSAHESVQRMNQSRSFAVLSDKPGRIEPKYKSTVPN